MTKEGGPTFDQTIRINGSTIVEKLRRVEGEGRFSSLAPLKGRMELRSPSLDLDGWLEEPAEKSSWDSVYRRSGSQT